MAGTNFDERKLGRNEEAVQQYKHGDRQ